MRIRSKFKRNIGGRVDRRIKKRIMRKITRRIRTKRGLEDDQRIKNEKDLEKCQEEREKRQDVILGNVKANNNHAIVIGCAEGWK